MHLASRAIGRALRQPPRGLPRRAQPRLRRIAACGWPPCCTTWATGRSAISSTAHYLADYGLNHETGRQPHHPRTSWATCSAAVRRNPNSRLADGETLDPRADLLPDRAARGDGGRRRPAMAPLPAQPVQRPVHRRQHGFRAPRRLHVGLQRAGLRPRPPAALQHVHRPRG